MTPEEVLKTCNSKMKKAYEIFNHDLASLRTGRANASMLDTIRIDVYGQKMPINQLATVSTPEARLLTVQVWDQNNVSLIDSAIKKSNLGINPQIDGQLMRIPVPSLISIRNIRRESNDNLKKNLKDKKISEDEFKNFEKKIQNLTDKQITELEKKLEEKEKEIMTV